MFPVPVVHSVTLCHRGVPYFPVWSEYRSLGRTCRVVPCRRYGVVSGREAVTVRALESRGWSLVCPLVHRRGPVHDWNTYGPEGALVRRRGVDQD